MSQDSRSQPSSGSRAFFAFIGAIIAGFALNTCSTVYLEQRSSDAMFNSNTTHLDLFLLYVSCAFVVILIFARDVRDYDVLQFDKEGDHTENMLTRRLPLLGCTLATLWSLIYEPTISCTGEVILGIWTLPFSLLGFILLATFVLSFQSLWKNHPEEVPSAMNHATASFGLLYRTAPKTFMTLILLMALAIPNHFLRYSYEKQGFGGNGKIEIYDNLTGSTRTVHFNTMKDCAPPPGRGS